MDSKLEKDCAGSKKDASDFFQDRKTLQRIQSCENYFDSIDTLAFKEVKAP